MQHPQTSAGTGPPARRPVPDEAAALRRRVVALREAGGCRERFLSSVTGIPSREVRRLRGLTP